MYNYTHYNIGERFVYQKNIHSENSQAKDVTMVTVVNGNGCVKCKAAVIIESFISNCEIKANKFTSNISPTVSFAFTRSMIYQKWYRSKGMTHQSFPDPLVRSTVRRDR